VLVLLLALSALLVLTAVFKVLVLPLAPSAQLAPSTTSLLALLVTNAPTTRSAVVRKTSSSFQPNYLEQ